MIFYLLADLFQIAQRLLFDGGETAGDIALGRLTVGQVRGLVRFDHIVLISLPGLAGISP